MYTVHIANLLLYVHTEISMMLIFLIFCNYYKLSSTSLRAGGDVLAIESCLIYFSSETMHQITFREIYLIWRKLKVKFGILHGQGKAIKLKSEAYLSI